MSQPSKEITIVIEASNPIDLKTKENAIQQIAKLDSDTLKKLHELSASKKAVDMLKSKWLMIKTMIM